MPSTSSISPFVYIGIVVYIIPVLIGLLRFTLPVWVGYIGMGLIVLGLVHTIWLRRSTS